MSKQEENTIVGISIGDINGVGCEVVLKTFEDNRMLEMCTPVIFANVKTISATRKAINSQVNFQRIDNLKSIIPGKLNVINVWTDQEDVVIGTTDEKAGIYAVKSLEAATKALKENQIDVLVTAPINKKNIQSEQFNFPGHTDYLAKELGGNALMFMIHDELKIGLFTDHVPVKDVSNHLNEALIRTKVDLIIKSLIQDFSITKPKVAVLGFNPHCGDNGVIGNEDDVLIKPILSKLFDEGKMVFGPFSADSFFGSRQYKNYDAVIATYHDQGLIPFKTLSFGEGVNYTAGLNKVRTSPDHGTAYEIAGKGEANETSFRQAVYKAIDIFNSRLTYNQISKNPLKKGISEKE
jgi:4-hydroxythreonine-4-phosphate dehydrogenase